MLRVVRVTMLMAVVWLVGGGAVVADEVVPAGPDFQVNETTLFRQWFPGVCVDGSGNFVVVWEGSDAELEGVFGMRFDSRGVQVTPEFQVNTTTADEQDRPSVCCADDGRFVVAWRDEAYYAADGDGAGIFGQRFDSSGVPAGDEFQLNTTVDNGQFDVRLACEPDGSFIGVWASFESPQVIRARRFDASGNGLGDDFVVSTYASFSKDRPDVASLGPAGAAVVWQTGGSPSFGQDGSDDAIVGRRLDDNGTPIGAEFIVNSTTLGRQNRPRVAGRDDGSYVVVWMDLNAADGSSGGIFGQRFDSAGQPVGAEFQVNDYTSGYQGAPAIAMMPDDGFIVVWNGGDSTDGQHDVVLRRYASDGTPSGGEFVVSDYVNGGGFYAAVDVESDGDFTVVWTEDDRDGSDLGVFGRRFSLMTAPPAPTPTPTAAFCTDAPRPDCQFAGKPVVKVKAKAGRERLLWKWLRGTTLDRADFGDPVTGGTTYRLCVYDFVDDVPSLAMDAFLEAGANWRAAGRRGYKYKNRGGNSSGIQKVVLKANPNPGRAKIVLKGKGAGLALPAPATADALFGQEPRVLLQLANDVGACWETSFTTPSRRNTVEQFKDIGA